MQSKRIRLKVAAPCSASWDDMKGGDAVRFCGSCKKSVYQLSAMTSEQIEALLAAQGDVCGRFYQRADGSVMTSDCEPGLARRRRKAAIAGVGAWLATATGFVLFSPGDQPPPPVAASAPSTPVTSPPVFDPAPTVDEALPSPPTQVFDEPEPQLEPPEDLVEPDPEPTHRPHAIMGRLVRVPELDLEPTMGLIDFDE